MDLTILDIKKLFDYIKRKRNLVIMNKSIKSGQ